MLGYCDNLCKTLPTEIDKIAVISYNLKRILFILSGSLGLLRLILLAANFRFSYLTDTWPRLFPPKLESTTFLLPPEEAQMVPTNPKKGLSLKNPTKPEFAMLR